MSGTLASARAREAALRARLADAVAERARAAKEAERLDGRAALAGADPAVAAAADEQRRLAGVTASSIDTLRAELRAAEAEVVSLEAAADAERAEQGNV